MIIMSIILIMIWSRLMIVAILGIGFSQILDDNYDEHDDNDVHDDDDDDDEFSGLTGSLGWASLRSLSLESPPSSTT